MTGGLPAPERAVCVFAGSTADVRPAYVEAARRLGERLAREGYALVYGGARVGLMGVVAEAVRAAGGRVIGVIPRVLVDREIAYDEADELIVTRDLRERKATMEERALAFVALPGGFGTLEEICEMLTLRHLDLHRKPIVLFNVGGFYEPLRELFEHIFREGFARPDRRALYRFAAEVDEVIAALREQAAQAPSSSAGR